MKLEDFCAGVYEYCSKLTSQDKFIVALFTAAEYGYVSKSYAKKLFTGEKGFVMKQKQPLRGKDNISSLILFFETEIDDAGATLIALGIPEKKEPNKKALAVALAQQIKLLIESDEEDVENILILQYQEAKQANVEVDASYAKPLYPSNSISVFHDSYHEIQSFDKITHSWELINAGNITWIGRKLVYKRSRRIDQKLIRMLLKFRK